MKLVREVRVAHLIGFWILPFVGICTLCAALVWLGTSDLSLLLKISACLLGVACFYFLLKRFAIGTVLAYKAFAPMRIRKECRYEPSCSSYMIMAINKYGLFKGMVKGFRRIRRCHPPNGGVDYP